VAGVAALLAQQHPDWKADRLKAALMGAAKPITGVDVFHGGTGRVDADRVTAQSVYPTVGSVSFGTQRYPYANDPATTKPVTYRNDGNAAVTLQLVLSTVDPNGAPAPSGFLKLDRSQLTVPAHGTATANVTLTPSVASLAFTYSARLTATSGSTVIQVAIGAVLEFESYDVNVKVIDRNGKPATGEQYVDVVDGNGSDHLVTLTNGAGTARLRRTDFSVVGFVQTGTTRTLVYLPQQLLDRTKTVTLDARKGKRVSVTTQRTDAVPLDTTLAIRPFNTFYGVDQTMVVPGKEQAYAAPVTTTPPSGSAAEFDFLIYAEVRSPANATKPYAYHLMYNWTDKIPTGLTFQPKDSELGTVKTNYSAQGKPALGQRVVFGTPPADHGAFGIWYEFAYPTHLTEYFTAAPTTWSQMTVRRAIDQPTQDPNEGLEIGKTQGYPAGTTRTENWDQPAFGPELQSRTYAGSTVNRFQDGLTVSVWPFAPSEPDHSSPAWLAAATGATTGKTWLTVNGQTIASNPEAGNLDVFGLPAAKTTYVLHVTASRSPSWSTLATHVDASWTFSSALPPGEYDTVFPPLLAVRASGAFDDLDRAPGNTAFPLDLRIETQEGATASPIKTVTAKYSTDDGKTWKTVTVTGSGTNRTVTIPNPKTGFVSLRFTATDTAGDKVDQTVIRAYTVK
jgi:hypothetical protein